MPRRHLALTREALTTLQSDELAAVSGGATNGPQCQVASLLLWSACVNVGSCGFGCTIDCETS